MQRLLVGLGLVVLVASIAAGVFLLKGKQGAAGGPAATSVTMSTPMGQSKDPNDPGEKMFRNGLYPEAIDYWTKEAAKGSVQAAHRLGVEYMDGKPGVVQRDYAKAMHYHLQAAKGGNPLSMFDLGSIYEYAYGVTKDMGLSARWYGHSAEYGLAQGQYNFATMLETGVGITKDEVEAYKYFILAARGGFTGIPYDANSYRIDKNAPLPTQILEGRLSRDQVAEGRQRADAFRPTVGPLAAE